MSDDPQQYQRADTLQDKQPDAKPKSSSVVLEAIKQAEKAFKRYHGDAKWIDKLYSDQIRNVSMVAQLDVSDNEYDLFWASMEILKPAIYAKPPVVVAKPRFSDAGQSEKTSGELLERVVNSEFERGDIDQVMLGVRDDLAILNRGVAWITLEEVENKNRICVEHLDREDFLHEPARKWADVSWVARRAWMTRIEMAERFRKPSGDAYQDADFEVLKADKSNGSTDESLKAAVWEVWSRVDNKVYWVSPGVDVMLDASDPHLNLQGFFPCPRPAYGTTQRRSLIPVPDYRRYARHFDQINTLTLRIYDLLREVKVRGLLAAGGDVGNALETAVAENTSAMFIPVPSSAMFAATANGGKLVEWIPLDVIATTIQGLIEARNQLFQDFYQLSGISDIMRGASEADETLGAQRLKSQYGSIRVRDKIDEIVRLARDAARIAVEIICDNYSDEDLLEIAQMELPTRAEVEKSLKDTQEAAKAELEKLGQKSEQMAQQAMASGKEIDPQQAQQQLQQAQQQIVAKYAPQLDQIKNTVVREDVLKLIHDRKARHLTIDIETDSTVLVDEIAEKQTRAEFLTAFSNASASIQPLIQAGEAGAKLAGAMLKFALQPYKASRELDQLIDEFIEQAPEIAAKMAGQGDDQAALAEANNKLAEAEMEKAKAAIAKVQADSALKQADLQRRMLELQQKAHADGQKADAEQSKLQLQLGQMQLVAEKQRAEIDNLTAQTAKILASIGLDERKQQLSEYTAASNEQARVTDQAMQAEQHATETDFREREHGRADRQQGFSEQQAERSETRADRQQEFAEQQADNPDA